jgi:shikimate kinase
MIYLTGFMGTGKTTIGKKLVELTGLPLIDMDDAICEKTGAAIPDIFKYATEAAFRAIETDVLFETADKGVGIVATGGGAPVKLLNRAVMKASGLVVNLTADLKTLKGRVGDAQSRPMWTQKVEALFDARRNAYADADLVIDTGELNIDEAAKKIIQAAGMIPETVPVLLEKQPYPVYLGRGIFEMLGNLIKRHLKPEGLFVMVDENVHKLYFNTINKAL